MTTTSRPPGAHRRVEPGQRSDLRESYEESGLFILAVSVVVFMSFALFLAWVIR